MLHGSVEPMQTSGLINTFSDNYTLCALSQALGKSLTLVSPRRARRVVKPRAAIAYDEQLPAAGEDMAAALE
jgi:hypothetical protein